MDKFWQKEKDRFAKLGNGNGNAAYLALDVHGSERADKIAFYCVSEDLTVSEHTYEELISKSNQVANYLKKLGIKPEASVFIYLPRTFETIISFYGILKAGCVAGILFSAFEEKALLDRLADSNAKAVITNGELLGRIQKIRKHLPDLETVIVVGGGTPDALSFDEVYRCSQTFDAAKKSFADSAFLLYTSGSTGKPKGILHSHGALVQLHVSFLQVFGAKTKDIYWCTADAGWITGVSYVLMAPVSCGVASVFFEGRFSAENWLKIIEKLKVSVFYSAPTAIRMLMASGVDTHDFLLNLRLVASVGEPLNTEAIYWGRKVFGLTILDTWFQTELGSITVSNTGGQEVRLGSMGKPLPGVRVEIKDEKGGEVDLGRKGELAIMPGSPSFMKNVWRNKKRYESYFHDGWYYTGDVVYMDSDEYIFFSSRGDDIINTQGERVGPFEIENALLAHPLVVESGVIGKPDELRGQVIKAFVVLSRRVGDIEALKEELKKFVKDQLGGLLYPKEIEIVDSLPKTRSGKIMRRVLKARELGLDQGDLSSLEE